MQFHTLFNYLEAAFWIILAGLCAVQAFKHNSTAYLLGYVLLLFFGCSDIVESRTGSWWQPWWLFIWKAVCLTGLAALIAWSLWTRVKKEDTNQLQADSGRSNSNRNSG